MHAHTAETGPLNIYEHPLPRAEALDLANTARELYHSAATGVPFGDMRVAFLKNAGHLMAPASEFMNQERSERLVIYVEEWPDDKDMVLLPRDLRFQWKRRQQKIDGVTEDVTEFFGINHAGAQTSVSFRQTTHKSISPDVRKPLTIQRHGPDAHQIISVLPPFAQGRLFQEKCDELTALKGQESTAAPERRPWFRRVLLRTIKQDTA